MALRSFRRLLERLLSVGTPNEYNRPTAGVAAAKCDPARTTGN
jgi:hypothetical protein